jgi:hypothetical protein
MHDSLDELSVLSLALQNREITLPRADRLIRRSIRRIEHLKEEPGPMMLEAQSAAVALKFGSTKLTANKKHVPIHTNQFLTSLANNLRERMFTTTAADADAGKSNYTTLVAQLAVLDPNYWPNEMHTNYGEDEVRKLCSRFTLPYADMRDAFCDFKDKAGVKVPTALQPLINCATVIPISTSECERGFSHMNLIMGPERSMLLIQHVSALMFIKLNGPPVVQWNPDCYVKSWLKHCHRSATDTRTRIAKPTHQKTAVDPIWKLF